jgi:hypothetical protein
VSTPDVVVAGAELLLEDAPVPPQATRNTIQIANRNMLAIKDVVRVPMEPSELPLKS